MKLRVKNCSYKVSMEVMNTEHKNIGTQGVQELFF